MYLKKAAYYDGDALIRILGGIRWSQCQSADNSDKEVLLIQGKGFICYMFVTNTDFHSNL